MALVQFSLVATRLLGTLVLVVALTHRQNGTRGKRIKKPNSASKPSRRPFASVVGRKRSHWTTCQLSRIAFEALKGGSHRCSPAQETCSAHRTAAALQGSKKQDAERVSALEEQLAAGKFRLQKTRLNIQQAQTEAERIALLEAAQMAAKTALLPLSPPISLPLSLLLLFAAAFAAAFATFFMPFSVVFSYSVVLVFLAVLFSAFMRTFAVVHTDLLTG